MKKKQIVGLVFWFIYLVCLIVGLIQVLSCTYPMPGECVGFATWQSRFWFFFEYFTLVYSPFLVIGLVLFIVGIVQKTREKSNEENFLD